MIGQTVSHYKILEKLGEGGMGVVYRAEDLTLTRSVALKFLPHGLEAHEPERARFLQEARAAAILNHPNICTIHEIAEADGQQFIVMEFVEGKTLREIVPVKKLQDAITYAIQIAEALQEAHTHGIVHRDIKAENIMVNSKNQVKVMDFGLAKLKGSLKLTKTSSTIGTLAYMAPEQIQGGEVDARNDIFSFGVVLYEMLTGHLPFRGDHEAAMMYSILNEEPASLQTYLPEAPSELLHTVNRALEKDPEERYQTVREMLIDLRRLKKDSSRVLRQPHDSTPISGPAGPVPPMEGKKGWRKRLGVGAVALVALCVIAVLLWILRAPAARLNPNRTSITLRAPFKEMGIPALSGDGNWLAFAARDESENWDVYMMNTAGGEPRRLTDEAAYMIQQVAFSPNVSQMVYDCLKIESNPFVKMKLVASQGGSSRTLADTATYAKWKLDGSRIGFMRLPGGPGEASSASGKLEIWSIRPDGTDKRLELIDTISSPGSASFCWSPDGGSIAWVRNYSEGYGEVMVRELATGKEWQLTSDKKTVDEVTWTTNGQILFVSNKSGQGNLWMVPAGGGDAIQVTQGAVPISGPRISADNKTLVYALYETIARVWLSSIDGSNPRLLTSADVRVTNARFSPDGKHISYVLADVDIYTPEAHLFVVDHDGKNQRQLTFGSETVIGCQWSPDGKWLSYLSRGITEPEDSCRVYLIQPFSLGPPRMLCKGQWSWWPDSESILVDTHMKTLRYPINGGLAVQVYKDSTWVPLVEGSKQLVFYDYRKGREGWWVVPVDSLEREKGKVRRILRTDALGGVSARDLRFWIYRKRFELWRVWTSTGKEERLGTALPGESWMQSVSMDGKEILWIRTSHPSKLVLVKNVFE